MVAEVPLTGLPLGSPALDALAVAHAGRLVHERIDDADTAALRGFVDRTVDRFGGIDHCIANAAVAHEGVLATAAVGRPMPGRGFNAAGILFP